MEKKTKIILADNHEIIRQGIKTIFKDFMGYEFPAEVANGRDLIKVLRRFKKIDIILLNYDLPPKNGFEILYKVVENFPSIKVIIVNMPDNFELQLQSIKIGAKAFLSKLFTIEDLVETLTEVDKNGLYVKSNIASKLDQLGAAMIVAFDNITDRELEILKEIDKGKTEAEIAIKFGISKATVHTHKNNMLKKTNTHNSTQLLKEAVRRGLL